MMINKFGHQGSSGGGKEKPSTAVSACKLSITNERICRLKGLLQQEGDKLFRSNPSEVNEIITSGERTMPMLIDSMNFVDSGDQKHIACTAVALAIKNCATDPASIPILLNALNQESAPKRYLIDVLGTVHNSKVAHTMTEMLQGGMVLRDIHSQLYVLSKTKNWSKLKPTLKNISAILDVVNTLTKNNKLELNCLLPLESTLKNMESASDSTALFKLLEDAHEPISNIKSKGTMDIRLSLDALKKVGDYKDMLLAVDLLSSSSKEIRLSAGFAIIYFCNKRKDITELQKNIITCKLLNSLSSGQNYYEGKVETLLSSNLTVYLETALREHKDAFTRNDFDPRAYRILVKTFFPKLPLLRESLFKMLELQPCYSTSLSFISPKSASPSLHYTINQESTSINQSLLPVFSDESIKKIHEFAVSKKTKLIISEGNNFYLILKEGKILNIYEGKNSLTDFEFAINSIENLLGLSAGILDINQMQRLYDILSKNFWSTIPSKLKFKIVDVFSYLDSTLIENWKQKVYLGAHSVSSELRDYVSEVFDRPEKEVRRKANFLSSVVIVSSDASFSGIIKSHIESELASENLQDKILVITESNTANAISTLRQEAGKVSLVILTRNIDSPVHLRKTKHYGEFGQWKVILENLKSQNIGAAVVLVHATKEGSKKHHKLISEAKLAPLTPPLYDKNRLLNSENMYEFLASKGVFKIARQNQAVRSASNVQGYYSHNLILKSLEKEFNITITKTEKNIDFGKKIKITEHEWGTLFELDGYYPKGSKRTRFLLLMPAAETPLSAHTGIKESTIEHLGGITPDSNYVYDVKYSARIYSDTGLFVPSGIIKEGDTLSKNDIRPLIKETGEGMYHLVTNRTGKALFFKLTEIL